MQITPNTNPYIGLTQNSAVTATQQAEQQNTSQVQAVTSTGDTVSLSAEALALAAADSTALGSNDRSNELPAATTLGSGSGNEPPQQ